MDQLAVYATAAVIGTIVLSMIFRRSFDPFAPIWLFLAGYAQIYVVQAISYREYALRVRGVELVTQANTRAFWALLWFLLIYFSGLGKKLAARLPRAPADWSPGLVVGIAPVMIVWGLVCSGFGLAGPSDLPISAEETLLRQFPIMMLVAGILLIVTGRQPDRPRPLLTAAGIGVAAAYCVIWMFNAKRSHTLIAVLTGVCACYLPTWRRPRLLVLMVMGFVCTLVVSLALGWRGTTKYDQTPQGFAQYLTEFRLESILVNMNMKERNEVDPEAGELVSKETEEYGAFLLMMDTVPAKSSYDYGSSYLRLFTTFIPRLVWPDKPLHGREQWVNAWIAGSEYRRDENFTGPSIGILGATQLNGGAVATLIVLGLLALGWSTAYEYFRHHAATPWAQAWWSMTYYNALMMTANDDPLVWFYYLYGHTTLVVMWITLKLMGRREGALNVGHSTLVTS